MYGSARPRVFHANGPGHGRIFTGVAFRRCVFATAVLQQRQFRQRFFHFPFLLRTGEAFQEFLVSSLCLSGFSKLIALQLRYADQSILAIFVRRIFADKKFVGIHCLLIVAASEAVAHFGVEFRHSQQGIGHFRRARSNQGHAAVTHHRLLVIRERALVAGLGV